MLFKKYASVTSRTYLNKFKGRPNGRLNAYNFEKYVRKPFSDKIFHQAAGGNRSIKKYNAYDSRLLVRDKVASRRGINKLRSPSSVLRKHIMSVRNSDTKELTASPLKQLRLGNGRNGNR